MKEKFPAIFHRETMRVSPPAFSGCLAMDTAVIERRDGVFESGQSRNCIEFFKRPGTLVTGGVWSSWPSHGVFLLLLHGCPRMASRGERVRARAVQGGGGGGGGGVR
jgi:hypothetical protein